MRVPPPDKIVAWPGDFAYAPTLEEFIEACGHSENMSVHLGLFGSHALASKGRAAGVGETAADAVARLWLALINEGPPALAAASIVDEVPKQIAVVCKERR